MSHNGEETTRDGWGETCSGTADALFADMSAFNGHAEHFNVAFIQMIWYMINMRLIVPAPYIEAEAERKTLIIFGRRPMSRMSRRHRSINTTMSTMMTSLTVELSDQSGVCCPLEWKAWKDETNSWPSAKREAIVSDVFNARGAEEWPRKTQRTQCLQAVEQRS